MSGADKKFDVKFISTNTRLGFVDVEEICNKSFVGCDRNGEPDNIYHHGLIAYGSVYEYVFDEGLIISDEKKYLEDNSPIWFDGSFQTDKTKEEFEEWVNKQKEHTFRAQDYHVSDHNCSHYTHAASELLGGTEPFKHSSQRDWLIRNRHIAIVIQGLLVASREPPKTNETEDGGDSTGGDETSQVVAVTELEKIVE